MAGGRPLDIARSPEYTVAGLHHALRHEPGRQIAPRVQPLWRLGAERSVPQPPPWT